MKTKLDCLYKLKKNVNDQIDREIDKEIKQIISNFRYHTPVLLRYNTGIIEKEEDVIVHHNNILLPSVCDDDNIAELFELEEQGLIFIEHL